MQLLNSIPIYLVSLNLPVVLQNESTATIVLYAVKNMMTIDDPAIVIQWNAPGFNDVLALEMASLVRQDKLSLTILRKIEEQMYMDKIPYLYLEPMMTSDSVRIIFPDGIRKF